MPLCGGFRLGLDICTSIEQIYIYTHSYIYMKYKYISIYMDVIICLYLLIYMRIYTRILYIIFYIYMPLCEGFRLGLHICTSIEQI